MGNQVDQLDLYQFDSIVRRRYYNGGTLVYLINQTASLVRTRAFGTSGATTIYSASPASLVRTRITTGGTVVWTSGVYIQDVSVPGTAFVIRDFGDVSKQVLTVNDTGITTIPGRFTSSDAGGNQHSFGTGSLLKSNDSIVMPEIVGYAVPNRVQGTLVSAIGATVISATWPGSTVAANMLWFFATCAGAGSADGQTITTPPAGYTQAFFVQSTHRTAVAYYKLNCGAAEAAPSITFSVACNMTLTIEEYSGIALTSALDKVATAYGVNNAQVVTGNTVLTTQANELWIGGLAIAKFTSLSPNNGFAQLLAASGVDNGAFTADEVVSATGIAGFIAAITVQTAYAGGVATFKAALSGGTVPTPPANSGVLYFADNGAGVSAAYYKDDAGVAHRVSALATRSLYLPARVFAFADGATNATLSAVPDSMRAFALADAVTQGFTFSFMVPDDWASGALTYRIYWSPGATDAVAHTIRWQTNAAEMVSGASIATASSAVTWTGASAAYTTPNLYIEPAQTLLTPTAPLTLIRGEIQRLGADAADTYIGVVNVIGIRIDYIS